MSFKESTNSTNHPEKDKILNSNSLILNKILQYMEGEHKPKDLSYCW